MHIILGATGHVGKAVLKKLIESGENVLAITHTSGNIDGLKKLGAEAALVDINDVELLTQTLMRGTSAFILNPPGNVTADSVEEEFRTAHAIIKAVANSGLKKVVVESTQGAQPGKAIGDFGVLYALEEGLKNTWSSVSVTRAGYYMSNWAMQLKNAKAGKIVSFFPSDFKLPMVAPDDLGAFNAQKLMHPFEDHFEIHDFVGPTEYSALDVAHALSEALNYHVEVEFIPQEKWFDTFKGMGFSDVAAESYSRMTELTLNRELNVSKEPIRGKTTLEEYIRDLVETEGERHYVTLNGQLAQF